MARTRRHFSRSIFISAVIAASPPARQVAAAPADQKPVIIRAVEGLRFDPPRIQATPGNKLHLRFENADTTAQPHNLLILQPGTREEVLAATLAMGPEGPSRGYVPINPHVLAASRLLTAGEAQEMEIKLPDTPGIYPVVCTFPGHGVIMFGAVYAGIVMPSRIEDDPQVPKPPPPPAITPDPRPMVRRTFLPEAGPAAIAVALPGILNLCWDAGPCRLRYVWQGGFLSMDRHFEGKGQALPRPLGPVVFSAPHTFPLRLNGKQGSLIRFRGHAWEKGVPVFEYSVDNKIVKESFSEINGALARRFRLPSASDPVEIHLGSSEAATLRASHGMVQEGVLRLTAEEATDVTIIYTFKSRPQAAPREN